MLKHMVSPHAACRVTQIPFPVYVFWSSSTTGDRSLCARVCRLLLGPLCDYIRVSIRIFLHHRTDLHCNLFKEYFCPVQSLGRKNSCLHGHCHGHHVLVLFLYHILMENHPLDLSSSAFVFLLEDSQFSS